jgi:hypothetical protein
VHSAGALWLDPLETADANRLDSHYKTNLPRPLCVDPGSLACA